MLRHPWDEFCKSCLKDAGCLANCPRCALGHRWGTGGLLCVFQAGCPTQGVARGAGVRWSSELPGSEHRSNSGPCHPSTHSLTHQQGVPRGPTLLARPDDPCQSSPELPRFQQAQCPPDLDSEPRDRPQQPRILRLCTLQPTVPGPLPTLLESSPVMSSGETAAAAAAAGNGVASQPPAAAALSDETKAQVQQVLTSDVRRPTPSLSTPTCSHIRYRSESR